MSKHTFFPYYGSKDNIGSTNLKTKEWQIVFDLMEDLDKIAKKLSKKTGKEVCLVLPTCHSKSPYFLPFITYDEDIAWEYGNQVLGYKKGKCTWSGIG